MYNNRDFVSCNNLLTKVEFQMRKCPICHSAPSTCAPLHCTELCVTQWGKIIYLNKFFHSHDTIKTRTCFPGMYWVFPWECSRPKGLTVLARIEICSWIKYQRYQLHNLIRLYFPVINQNSQLLLQPNNLVVHYNPNTLWTNSEGLSAPCMVSMSSSVP